MARFEKLEERGIQFYASHGKISSKLPVFYNPAMRNNRDLSVLVLKALGKKDMRIALPLAATGIRGIRFWKELGQSTFASLRMNDASPDAVALMEKNLALNKMTSKRIAVTRDDASAFLLKGGKQDYIDIDPFGFPGPFLDAACKMIANDGMLAVTATDCGALCGSYPGAGERKYWALPARNMFMHETGLRILARRVQLVAAQYGKAATPALSYSKEHYMRIFFRVKSGRQAADKVISQHGILSFCRKCLRWEASSIPAGQKCACGNALDYAGPMFLGALWDSSLLAKLLELNSYPDLEKLLATLCGESAVSAVGYYDLHAVVRAHGLKHIPRREALIAELADRGFDASATHFTGRGVRTTAPFDDMLKVLRT